MEVGKDVVKRIEQRREQIERERKGQGGRVDGALEEEGGA